MSANPSTLIIVVIIILFVLIYVDMSHDNNVNSKRLEHNTNINQLVETETELDSEEIRTDETMGDIDIKIDLNDPGRSPLKVNPYDLQIITAGLGPEVRKLGHLESELSDVRMRQIMNTNLLEKLYKKDVLGDYMTRGWFVQVYDVISSPHGVTLGAEIDRFHGIRRICFRAQNNYPFLGIPQDPLYLPKPNFIGFRAMTIFKIPRTGYYDFRVLSDDGSRLMYQVVNSDVMIDEKNIRNTWRPLIDQWRFQSETWNYSEQLYFNQSDLVLLRFDYFQADANSTACIKVRYTEVGDEANQDMEEKGNMFDDFNVGDMYCSLLWSNVPLMGVR